ncbi:hypothetical protein [Natrinema sp. H-ect4]|uniref:hypothetical protein n=1 Tax=Natrinema sp. H-ect4 TaxID=3242699 RepID=UPI0035A87873
MKAIVRANFDDSVSASERRTGRFTVLSRLLAAKMSARTDGPFGTIVDASAGTGASTHVFAALDWESRSQSGANGIETALNDAFTVTTGTWRFATMIADVRRFQAIPAMVARLYPKRGIEERVTKARDLLDGLEGTIEQRWRWIVGVVE